MNYPTCDNACTLMGWSEYILGDGCGELHISVPPETDTTQIFMAFCHCEQEMIKVNGWLYDEHQLIWEGIKCNQ